LEITATTKHLALPEGVFQQHTQLAGKPSSICCLAPSCSISELTGTAIVQGNGLYQKTGLSYRQHAMQCYHSQFETAQGHKSEACQASSPPVHRVATFPGSAACRAACLAAF